MSTRSLRLGAPLLLSVAVAVGATGCSPEQAGAAAVIGDRTVSNQDLQSALSGLRKGNQDFAQVEQLDRLVLFDLIAGPFLKQAASAEGLGVSSSEAQAALPQTPSADPQALQALEAQIALNKLSQGQKTAALARVGDQLRRAKVQVSPRYGRFDPKQLTIVDSSPNWLQGRATPSATGVPTPTATP